MPIDALTVKQTILDLTLMMGDLVVKGTATSASSTTLVDTNNLLFSNDDDLNGTWVGIYEGTGVGDERAVSDFTASSDTITVVDTWSSTLNTTSDYFVTRRWRPQQYIDAIAGAVRRAAHKQLLHLDDVTGFQHELITFGDILSTDGNGNGQMENFTTNVPTGWTADGNTTSASDSDTDDVRRGTFSYKMTSDGSNLAQITQAIKFFERYASSDIRMYAWVRADTTARSLIRLDDGPSTAVTDTEADGVNVWEELNALLTVSDAPTGIDIDCEISAGGAVNTNFDDVRLIWEGGTIYEYDLPGRLAYLSKVEAAVGTTEEGASNVYGWVEIPRWMWKVQGGSNAKLVFDPAAYNPPRNVRCRLTGQAYPATITAATPATAYAETVEANAEYVKAYAKWYLLNSLPYDILADETIRRQVRDAWGFMLEMEETMSVSVNPGSEIVRAN